MQTIQQAIELAKSVSKQTCDCWIVDSQLPEIGYMVLSVDAVEKRKIPAHRLVRLYVNGKWEREVL